MENSLDKDSNVIKLLVNKIWAIVASLFSSLFTKVAFLIFEDTYLLSTIIIDEFKRRTIFQLFSYPISKISYFRGKIRLSVILIAFCAHFSAHLVIQLFIEFWLL